MSKGSTQKARASGIMEINPGSTSKYVSQWSREIGHAVVVLILTIAFSVLLGEFTFLKGTEAIYKGLFRFLRLTIVLCLPVYLLPPILGSIGSVIREQSEAFFRIKENQSLGIHPVKHWLLRPLQGIGVMLILGTKILWVLELAAGEPLSPALLIPKGQFETGRFAVVTGVTILVSVFLSTLWTSDDLGIRYFSRKNHEIRMIGKHVGTLMPALLGFYGAYTLLNRFPMAQALSYLIQIVLILYPPFTVFTVFHAHFLRKRAEIVLDGLLIKEKYQWD